MRGFKHIDMNGIIILISIVALLVTFLLYGRLSNAGILLTEEMSNRLVNLSILVYLMLFTTLPTITIALYRISKRELSKEGISVIKYILSLFKYKRYLRIFLASLIVYGIFYSFITGLLVYRSEQDVSNIDIPSFKIIPCCGLPGYMPILIINITQHFGMLITPINLIMLVVVSTLVGVNTMISIFIYDSKKVSNKVLPAFAAMGLFTGCPTCAGISFLLIFGLSSNTLAILAPLQSLFIAISIPALLLAPAFMIKRFHANCNLV